MTTINLAWYQYPESDVASYHVWRSIVGFVAPVLTPTALAGLTLTLSIDGGANQTVTFDGVNSAVVNINNQVTGGQAYASIAFPTTFLFRDNVREAPGTVQIVGGTALTALGLTAGTISQLSVIGLLATVPAGSPATAAVTYEDPDGALQDFYALSSIDHLGNESLQTTPKQPITATGNLCVIEGVVTDMQGVRLVDQEVRAHLMNYPKSLAQGAYINKREPLTTLTGDDGRFSLTVLQCTLIRLEIPSVGYGRNIKVPAQAFAFISDLEVDLDYKFNPDPLLGEI